MTVRELIGLLRDLPDQEAVVHMDFEYMAPPARNVYVAPGGDVLIE